MDFACISSGSSGNSSVVRYAESALLIDCGLTLKQTLLRLDELDLHPSKLIGIVVTHEHSDHSSGVGRIARRFNLPVWMSHGTHRRTRDTRIADLRYFCAEQKFAVGPFEIHPFAVPHDAAEACQFVISHGAQKLAILTDIGMITPHVIDRLKTATGLVLECNHDETMLRNGPYPPALQARVGGQYGHLSNRQAAGLLKAFDTRALRFILLAHLSEKNNTPDKAVDAIASVLPDGAARLTVLSQSQCSRWFKLDDLTDCGQAGRRISKSSEFS